MYIKSFKINEVNINVKLLFTKSEAIAICKKDKNEVREVFLQHLAEKLMEIEDVSKIVGDDHIPFPEKKEVSNVLSATNLLGDENEPSNT